MPANASLPSETGMLHCTRLRGRTAQHLEIGIKNCIGCDGAGRRNHQLTADYLAGKPKPEQPRHDPATGFRLGEHSFVVLSSCSHRGIINSLQRTQEVSRFEKIHALVVGKDAAAAQFKVRDSRRSRCGERVIATGFPALAMPDRERR